MTRKVHVKPGGLAATQAKGGIVVVTMFLLFGLVFGFVVILDTPDSETGLKFLIGGFFLIWVVVCISLIVAFVRILSKSKNIEDNSIVEFQFEETAEPPASSGGSEFDVRLRKLEALKRDGLITEAEYLNKRAEILQEKW